MLLSADNSTGLHLRVLARLSKLLKDQSFKQKLIQTDSASAVMDVLREADEEF
jgi:PTS system nitrogen regulatory IIA component